jgi:hypothetical protein
MNRIIPESKQPVETLSLIIQPDFMFRFDFLPLCSVASHRTVNVPDRCWADQVSRAF